MFHAASGTSRVTSDHRNAELLSGASADKLFIRNMRRRGERERHCDAREVSPRKFRERPVMHGFFSRRERGKRGVRIWGRWVLGYFVNNLKF